MDRRNTPVFLLIYMLEHECLTEIRLLQEADPRILCHFELGMHVYRVHPIIFPFPKDLRKILPPVVIQKPFPLSALQLL